MRDKLFNDLEGLRVAIDIESRGHEFYQQAYNSALKPEYKELFILLRDEELHHLELFTKAFNTLLEKKNADEIDYLFDADTSRYLSVLAEEHVFPKKEQAAAKITELGSLKAILEMAIQAEKDSILLYDELSVKARFEDAKKIFSFLKTEEQEHVIKLKEILNGWA